MEMTGLDEDRNELMRLDSQPALTTSHKNWPRLFSAAGWAELNLGVKWSRSEKKSTI